MHGIETDLLTNRATAAYWETAGWHKLGVVGTEKLSAEQSLGLANISDLDYRLLPQYAMHEDGALLETGKMTCVAKHPFTGNDRVIGGTMAPNYSFVSPEELARFADMLVDEGAHMAGIGLVDQGTQMFVSLKITDLTFGGQDRAGAFLTVATSFNASRPTLAKFELFRVECANMLSMSYGSKSEYEFRARHTGAPILLRVEEARQALQMAWKSTEEFSAQVERWIAQDVTNAQFDAIVKDYVPMPKEPSKAMETKIEKAWGEIMSNWNYGAESSIAGTQWGAINALTDWVDHTKGNFQDNSLRMVRSFLDDRYEVDRKRAIKVTEKVLASV